MIPPRLLIWKLSLGVFIPQYGLLLKAEGRNYLNYGMIGNDCSSAFTCHIWSLCPFCHRKTSHSQSKKSKFLWLSLISKGPDTWVD